MGFLKGLKKKEPEVKEVIDNSSEDFTKEEVSLMFEYLQNIVPTSMRSKEGVLEYIKSNLEAEERQDTVDEL